MQSIVISLKKQVICNKKYKNCDEIKNGFLWNFKKVNLKWWIWFDTDDQDKVWKLLIGSPI